MDLSYYRLNAPQKVLYRVKNFFTGFPARTKAFLRGARLRTAGFLKGILKSLETLGKNFVRGDLMTKLSYLFMGFGHMFHGEALRGVLYFLVQVAYVLYMALFGGSCLAGFMRGFFTGGTLGTVETQDVFNEEDMVWEKIPGDNSFKIMLYGILTILLTVFFVMLYLKSVRESGEVEQRAVIGLKAKGFRSETGELMDNKFHITLLSLPMVGLFMFTIVPLITMIFIAFTNYDAAHEVPQHLFRWVGFRNFGNILGGDAAMTRTFGRVLWWTLVWAFFATFTNYFFGMILALLINKKGVRFKKAFRTIFVATIAVPQFVSLLLMSKMLDADGGILTKFINDLFNMKLMFGLDINTTRAMIILVNMWIGVPYSMLICSGILMNIPSDLYESAKIDGAGPVKAFLKITLPYMLFVTGPYLITQFIGNINNFNVIYLLSGGGPGDVMKYTDGAKGTDLLITWLYRLSLGSERNYKLAAVIGIIVFVISAVFSLIVYNKSSAVKKEEDFQ